MAYHVDDSFTFGFRAVRENAPSSSGVYTIYSSQRWVYVGDSDNIRQSLFLHLNDKNARMNGFGPLSFSFEMAPPIERVSRRNALVAELVPACNSSRG
jgi:hypothetical protein